MFGVCMSVCVCVGVCVRGLVVESQLASLRVSGAQFGWLCFGCLDAASVLWKL